MDEGAISLFQSAKGRNIFRVDMKPELLAPVPCRHLSGVLEVCRTAGRVAFASNRWEVFEGAGTCVEAGWAVAIYASRPELGDPDHLFIPARASLVGTFVSWVRADPRFGRHPNSNVRPVSTGTDIPVIGFWEVKDLRRLASDRCIPLSIFQTATNNRPISRPPLGPTIVQRTS
jgi:hypothetical protein